MSTLSVDGCLLSCDAGWVDTNNLEKHTASIFRAEVTSVNGILHVVHTDKLLQVVLSHEVTTVWVELKRSEPHIRLRNPSEQEVI
jgi:hypothetical protein